MKNPYEVLEQKELAVMRIRKEIDALRLTIQLIDEEDSTDGKPAEMPRPSPRLVDEQGCDTAP